MKKKIPLSLLAVLLCCLVAVLPSACSILYFNITVSRRLETDAQQTVTFYLRQLAAQTDSLLNTLRGSIYYLMSDTRTNMLMQDLSGSSAMERLEVEEGLSRAFFLGDRVDSNIVTGIYLLKSQAEYLSILRSGIFRGTTQRVLHIYNTYPDKNSARDLYTDAASPGYCYYIVDYLDLQSMNILGKIIIELDASYFMDTAYIDSIYHGSVVMLRHTDGKILYTTAPNFALQQEPVAEQTYLAADGQEYYYTCAYLPPNHIKIDIFVPKSEILAAVWQTSRVYIIFAALVLGTTLLLGMLIMAFVSKPLRQMLHKIDKLATGDFAVRMQPTPYRETERMAAAFNHMADRLEQLFHEVYTKGLLLREAEFQLLESQIRPHFIFNILQLINMRCLAAGQNDICQTVSNLAQLLRVNITHKHKQTITLKEELRYVRYYLELQKERFEEKLQYEIALEDPEVLVYALPKLTIQPLVENSIVHGLEPKRGGGSLRIAIWEEETELYIRITDDGVGFDTTQLKLDAQQPMQEDSPHHHVALFNINRRIQLLYGAAYGLQIVSALGQGTEITIILPIDEKNLPKGEFPDAENHDCGQ